MTATVTALNIKTMEDKRLWEDEVISMKQEILTSKKKPIEILCEVFEYCQGEYDIWENNTKLSYLYDLLQEFTNNVPENNIELIKSSRKLIKLWMNEESKEEIRKGDIQLFYAILGFIDFLKSNEIYFDIIFSTN